MVNHAIGRLNLIGAMVWLTVACGGLAEAGGVVSPATGGVGPGGTSHSGGAAAGRGAGGAGATGGTSASTGPRECVRDADCQVLGDCCGCWAVPTGTQSTCPLDCSADGCRDFGALPSARCAFGQCVLGVQCTGTVSCPALPPQCGSGQVPTIQGDCYGPCIPATECPAVSGCPVCYAPTQMCVYEYGAVGVEHCAAIPAACGSQPSCACAGGLCGGIEPCQDIAQGIRCGLG